MMKLFKDTSVAQENCNKFWDMSNGIVPIPRMELTCSCGATGTMTCRNISWRQKPSTPRPYRCDISFKCLNCSRIAHHGVVITQAMFNRAEGFTENGKIHTWRDIRDKLIQLKIIEE